MIRREENREMVQGAFRSGDWKLIVNAWCSGYYSHDSRIIEVSDSLRQQLCAGFVLSRGCCLVSSCLASHGAAIRGKRPKKENEHDRKPVGQVVARTPAPPSCVCSCEDVAALLAANRRPKSPLGSPALIFAAKPAVGRTLVRKTQTRLYQSRVFSPLAC